MIYLKTSTNGYAGHKDQQGIGSVVQWSLILYCITKQHGFGFAADPFSQVGHYQYNGYSQEDWDEMFTRFFGFKNKATTHVAPSNISIDALKHYEDNSVVEVSKDFIKANGFSSHHLKVFKEGRYLNDVKTNMQKQPGFNVSIHLRSVNPGDTYMGGSNFDVFGVHVQLDKIRHLIDQVKTKCPHANINVHGQGDGKGFEVLGGVNLCLNQLPTDDITIMSNADIFIMAKSSYSWISHLLNVDGISAIRNNFWHNVYPNTLEINDKFDIIWKN